MAFDLYFAGSAEAEVNNFIFEQGCNHLYSQYNDRSQIAKWNELADAHPENTTSKLFIDSGAYTVYTRQKTLDVDEYINYLNSMDKYLTIFAQVDKIPGVHGQPKTKEQVLEAPKLSWENYLYMREKVNSPDKLLPIFHRREDFSWLEQMLETTFDSKHIPYIGIAATTDSSTKEKEAWFEKVFEVIRNSSNPNVKTHAFGMTSLKLLEKFPFTSADSTSWLMTAVTGGIMTKYGVICVSDRQYNNKDHIKHLSDTARKDIDEYIQSFGFTWEELAAEYKNRHKFNVLYLKQWCENYKYKGNHSHKRSLF